MSGLSTSILLLVIFCAVFSTVLSCGGSWQKAPYQKCYLFQATPSTWDQANASCLKQGGALATPSSLEEIIWIKGYRLHYGLTEGYWIGGIKKANKWYWEGLRNNHPILVTDWTSGQPDNATGNQNCLALFYQNLSPQLKWGDGQCHIRLGFICEKTYLGNAIG